MTRRTPTTRRFSQFRAIRLRKDESGDHGVTTPPANANNQGGNPPPASGESGQADNTGPKFDPATFWTGSGDETGKVPAGESAAKPDSSSGTEPQPTPAQALGTALQQLQLGNNVMTPEVIAELAEGKPEKFHAGMAEFGRQAVAESIKLMIPVMRQLQEELTQSFEAKLNGTLTSRDNAADLLAAIPSAADPSVRPMVDSIFNRAMVVAKGDRKVAIDFTKQMLLIQSERLGTDIGLPPRNPADGGALVPSSTNWLDELAGR